MTFSSGRGRNKNLIMGNPIEGGVLDVNPFCDCQSGDIYVGVVPSSPETSAV